MALIQETLPGLFNGVSQQPAALRLKNQAEEQINAVGSLVYGLHKRPPTRAMSGYTGGLPGRFYTHAIERDNEEQYFVFFTDSENSPIQVWDILNEEAKTVDYGWLDDNLNFTRDLTVMDYITQGSSSLTAANRIRVSTIADYTVIVNKTVKTDLDAGSSPGDPEEKNYADVIYNPGGTWKVLVDGNVIYTSGSLSSGIEAEEVARNLRDGINGSSYATNQNANAAANDGVVWMTHDDGREFLLQVAAPRKDAVTVINSRKAVNFDQLFEAYKVPGAWFEIGQNQYGEEASYYVRSIDGYWEEVTRWEILNSLKAETWPHRLVRMADGTFVCAPINYKDRTVGDTKSAPNPSCIGKEIQNVTFYQNRLLFQSETNVLFSRTGDYFNFYPGTAREVLADDPIDIGMATTGVTALREAIPFNKNLLLRADNHQFILSYTGNGLTPQTVSVDRTTTFQTVQHSESTASGSSLYFTCPQQKFLAVREYYVEPDSLVEDAADVTIQCPGYIRYDDPNDDHPSVKLVSIPQLDLLFLHSSADPYHVYVYSYYWKGEEKVQSAWSKFEFNHKIQGIVTVGSDLYLVADIGADTIILKMELNNIPETMVYIDQWVLRDGTLSTDGTETVFDVGYELAPLSTTGDYVIIDSVTHERLDGSYVSGDKEMRVPGDYTSNSYYIGQNYTMKYKFSRWLLKNKNGAILPGRTQLRTIELTYRDTTYFTLRIDSEGRDTQWRQFPSLTIDQDELNVQSKKTGTTRFMVLGNSEKTTITLENGSPHPSTIQGATFEGYYHSRGKTI